MNTDNTSTRRSFLKGGALIAAPLAAVAAPALVKADDELNARLAKLENEAAIRELHQTWLRRINTGEADAAAPLLSDRERTAFDQAVRSVAPDHAGQPDVVEVSADGRALTVGSTAPWNSKPRSRRIALSRRWRASKAAASSAGRSAAC